MGSIRFGRLRETSWTRLLPSVLLAMVLAAGCTPSSAGTPRPAKAAERVEAEAGTEVVAQAEEPLRSALLRLNHYRSMMKLPPVRPDVALGAACANHSRYMVENRIKGADLYLVDGILSGDLGNPGTHLETRTSPYYTAEGANAARYGVTVRSLALPATGDGIIDQMIAMPFTALILFDPQLVRIGYGSYCKVHECVSTLSLKWGLDKNEKERLYAESGARLWNPALGALPATPGRLRKPLEFPPAGATVSLASYQGHDLPNPLSGCSGYKLPVGVPILLQLGAASQKEAEVKVTDHSFSGDGGPLESCVFDATTYHDPDAYQERIGRQRLHRFGAAILIPRRPLRPGHTYHVSITADSQTYEWSFHNASKAH